MNACRVEEFPSPPLLLTSPLEGEVAAGSRRESSRRVGGERHSLRSALPPTRRVQSDAATSPSRGEVKTNTPLTSPAREWPRWLV
jgi:hypothetical protein